MNRNWISLGIAVLLAISGVICHAEDDPAVGRKYALLIGVNPYDGNPLQALTCCENDVNDLAEVLRGPAYAYNRVVVLTYSEALKHPDRADLLPTAANIRTHLKSLLKALKPVDTVLIGMSGHGAILKKDATKPHGKANDVFYYCPMYSNIDDDTKRDTLISVDELWKMLDGVQALGKILVTDTCRSGAKDAESITQPVVSPPPSGTVALFSCKQGQFSFVPKEKNGHSYLFRFLIDGLKGNKDTINSRTGEIPWSKLESYIQTEVPGAVQDDYGPNAEQTPDYMGVDHGLILARSEEWKKANRVVPDATKFEAKPAAQDKALVLDLGNGVKMELVRITNGTFTMGDKDEGPAHQVTLTRDFFMGKYAVTQAQYQAVMGTNPSSFKDNADSATRPVEEVSWDDAQEFCKKLGALTGKTIQLPTEAQWEYACRAGTTTAYYTGDTEADLARAGWYGDDKGNADKETHPVGKKTPNGFGLYDMHGNVWQWCQDWYGSYAAGAQTDPKGSATGAERVLRGGAWGSTPNHCRSAHRHDDAPDFRDDRFGFRVVVSLD